jgi:predicted transcriptional regulator
MLYSITTTAAVSTAEQNFSKSDRFNLLEAAQDFKLTASEQAVYLYLVRIADSDRTSSRTVEQIAARCNLRSRVTVRRALDSLHQMRLIDFTQGRSGYIYSLTDPSVWISRLVTKEKSVTRIRTNRTNDQKMIASDDQKMIVTDDQKLIIDQQQDSGLPPLKGVIQESVVVGEAVEASDQNLIVSKSDRTEPEVKPEPEKPELEPEEPKLEESKPEEPLAKPPVDLESKIAAARSIGCNVGICWDCGQEVVRIDGALKTIAEFMATPVGVFKQSVEYCQSGLDLCRQQIDKIKERLRSPRVMRLEGLVASC